MRIPWPVEQIEKFARFSSCVLLTFIVSRRWTINVVTRLGALNILYNTFFSPLFQPVPFYKYFIHIPDCEFRVNAIRARDPKTKNPPDAKPPTRGCVIRVRLQVEGTRLRHFWTNLMLVILLLDKKQNNFVFLHSHYQRKSEFNLHRRASINQRKRKTIPSDFWLNIFRSI